jgi:hypothetical protein
MVLLPPSGKTIDLNDSDIQQLPKEVQEMIKRHFVDEAMYTQFQKLD